MSRSQNELKKCHPSIRACLIIGLCALILGEFVLIQDSHAVLVTTKEEAAFDNETTTLLSAKKMICALGLHGELIVTGAARPGTKAFILERPAGEYDIAFFDFPDRYYFGHISRTGEIHYNYEKLPPGIERNKFCGPSIWPTKNAEGALDFTMPEKPVVLADLNAHPTPSLNEKDYIAVGYACVDGSVHILQDKHIQSPFAFIMTENSSGDMELAAPGHSDEPILKIVNGGWADSWLVFVRDGARKVLEQERRFEWPYHNASGSPSLRPHLILSPSQFSVIPNWTVYDKNGKRIFTKQAPTP